MERIGETVRRELGRFGTAGAMADIVEAWPGAVGDQVAANAWPARLARDGTLHVSASSSAWAFELGHLAGEILPRLQETLGSSAPERLKFAPGPLPEPDPAVSAPPREPLPEPTLEQAREARSWVSGIDSEELRKTVEKAARASLARAGSGRRI
ncbi:MAG TPA: DUF721 domain-containing protein [Gaiellaceae bacterium]|nr:DUF721 domain-containing protein [Gaiellaceae bacterium]